jgi:hypothetical protein
MKITLRKRFLFLAILSLFLGAWMVTHASAVTNPEFKLTASDGTSWDQFGGSVSISGDYAIVGASEDNDNGNNDSGSAYVFERINSSWTEIAKLTASDGASEDYFGLSVSISGDYAIVGALGDDDNGTNYCGSELFFVSI